MRVASTGSAAEPLDSVDTGGTAPGSSAPARRPPRGLLAAALVVGVVFLGPFAYVAWRNIDLGTDLGSLLPGTAADVCVLDDSFEVTRTVVFGSESFAA